MCGAEQEKGAPRPEGMPSRAQKDSIERRRELYAKKFKHFRMEDIDEHFYFEAESMVIVFTLVYRINALYEVIRRVTQKYGARVNIGAADMTAAATNESTMRMEPLPRMAYLSGEYVYNELMDSQA